VGYYQQVHLKENIEKEINVETVEHTPNWEVINGNLQAEVARYRTQVAGFKAIIENLPWEDINIGQFSPAADCPDVASARNQFINLGCDADIVMAGAVRDYSVCVKMAVTFYYTVEASSEEDAEEKVDDLVSSEYVNAGYADEADLDIYDYEVEVNER
jgi:hypothetical protein